MVSALILGVTIVAFDGSPFNGLSSDSILNGESESNALSDSTGPASLWKIIDALEVTIFGTSAKYLQSLEAFEVTPSKS